MSEIDPPHPRDTGPGPDDSVRRRLGRPVTAPDFLLSGPLGSVRTQGARRTFSGREAALAALRDGTVELLVGALPFDPDDPVALTEPTRVIVSDGPLEPPAYYRTRPPRGRVVEELPSRLAHRERVLRDIADIRTHGLVDKVVAARAVRVRTDAPLDPLALAARLIDRSADGEGFVADLGPAGPDYAGATLVGSSPELLVRVTGDAVVSHPLAGSLPRSADPAEDRRRAEALADSAKNLAEHAYVTSAIADVLTPLCRDLVVPPRPTLTATREMWHLGTEITAVLAEPRTALDLAIVLHPTPAIGGSPRAGALDRIRRVEHSRRFYAGAVGWCDAAGDGEFRVSIRCAEVAADGSEVLAWAGGGIVADSDPDEELAETDAKLRTVLGAFGVEADV